MGRPALVQDTGWSQIIPEGRGLMSFTDGSEAIEKLGQLIADQRHHAQYAREIAIEWFDSRRVLEDLLDHCGLSL
jgi:hypothetical protein